MKTKRVLLACLILSLTLTMSVIAAETKENSSVLFTNAKVFDGQNDVVANTCFTIPASTWELCVLGN